MIVQPPTVPGYAILNLIGKGQFGHVYKAKKEGSNQEFAIKVLQKAMIGSHPKLTEFFETEVAIMQKISHPNILHCHAKIEDVNNYYLVLDYCNLGDLEQFLDKRCPAKRMKESEAVHFLKQLMNGFYVLHKNKIMHRDFKPANVFIHNDNVVIGDFGFAKSGADLTNSLVGSPLFTAPELQLLGGGQSPYTAKVDIFSIGVTYYRMVVGKYPWSPKSREDLRRCINEQSGHQLPFPADSNLSPATKDFLRQATQSDPDNRPTLDQLIGHYIFDTDFSADSAGLRSVMFFGNKITADRLFEENRLNAVGVVDFIDLEHYDKNTIAHAVSYPSAPSLQSQVKVKDFADSISRLYHHKQVAGFVVAASHDLLAISGIVRQSLVQQSTAIISLLLAKVAHGINSGIVDSLVDRHNRYEVADFDAFACSPECEAILAELFEDNGWLADCLESLKSQLAADADLRQSPDFAACVSLLDGQSDTGKIDAVLADHISLLHLCKDDVDACLDDQQRRIFARSLAKTAISQKHDYYLPATSAVGSFDWPLFDDLLQDGNSYDDILANVRLVLGYDH